MSLRNCQECGKQVSTEAAACPHCGAKVRSSPGFLTVSVLIVLGILVIRSLASSSSPSPSKLPPPRPPDTTEQIAEKKQEESRFQMAVLYAATLKRSLRDPESVRWSSISTNDDASVVCLDYRARNGFNGMAHEVAVVAAGKTSNKAAAWNKHCAQKPLHNLTSLVEYALKQQ